MKQCETLAYLAGAMDSDGSIGIKKSTYHRRVRGDAKNAIYSERISLKQVTPQIPQLLQETFGGSLGKHLPGTPNSKPLYVYSATDVNAANACQAMLPYLRVKRRQAENLLRLRASKGGRMWQASYWFEKEYPRWRRMELVTGTEAAAIIGYTNKGSVSQAIRNGTLLALPYDNTGRERPRIPRLLAERVAESAGRGGKHIQAPQLIALRETLYQRARELNKTGINGTPTYFKTGPYQQID